MRVSPTPSAPTRDARSPAPSRDWDAAEAAHPDDECAPVVGLEPAAPAVWPLPGVVPEAPPLPPPLVGPVPKPVPPLPLPEPELPNVPPFEAPPELAQPHTGQFALTDRVHWYVFESVVWSAAAWSSRSVASAAC